MTKICLFEDSGWRKLLPLTWLHPVWELRFGAYSFLARVRALEQPVSLKGHCRSWLQRVGEERGGPPPPETAEYDTLYLNARVVDPQGIVEDAISYPTGFTLWNDGELVAFRLNRRLSSLPPPEELSRWAGDLGLPRQTTQAKLFARWWELVNLNESALIADAAHFELGACHGSLGSGSHLVGSDHIYIASNVAVDPGAVVDARSGPVVVEEETEIGSNAIVTGPAHIGKNCRIKPCSQIGPNVSLGPHSRVAGEISNTIFLGRSNKQHFGFLGHGYVGEWVNLGAGTTNSNLKNTYSTVRVWVDGTVEDSAQTFAGCVIGDHSKTAIGTVLNTGSVIGVASNVFGHGFPPKFIPSFSWGFTAERVNNMRVVLSTAARVMERRDRQLTEAEGELLRTVFQMTESERAG
jgi:UDP-N-acetylglucosamine diphosphorylase/glucosamine-1-phosphate N-acetyltransferase